MASQLNRAIEVMDRLRSPGGCPWDAEQTHASLARYLLEETYEVLEAIETADVALLREELGDLLLQVLFHARLAEERSEPFGIEDVAGDLVDKLIRRHPHVFAPPVDMGAIDADPADANPADANTIDAGVVEVTWEQQKITEKGRTSAVDGVPIAQPSLALAAKLVARASRAGIDVAPPFDDEFGQKLFAVVRDAVAAGVDPEGALRRTARAYRAAIITAERAAAQHPESAAAAAASS